MGEKSPIPTIIVRGVVGFVDGVGGPESGRRAGNFIRGVNAVSGCGGGALRQGWVALLAGRWPAASGSTIVGVVAVWRFIELFSTAETSRKNFPVQGYGGGNF